MERAHFKQMPMRRAPRLLFWLAAAVVSAGVPAAQQPVLPQFQTGVDVLQLDVSVLDKKRAAISDLTLADFTVEIDGRAVPIVAFTPVRLDATARPKLPGPPDFPPDVVANDGPTEGRLVVFHFDQNVFPWEMIEGRKIVREAIAALGPADRPTTRLGYAVGLDSAAEQA
jgi:hypothetical protein